MARRYKSGVKRYLKKRVIKKKAKAFLRKKSPYDKGHFATCQVTTDWVNNAWATGDAAYTGRMQIWWGGAKTGTNNGYQISMYDSPEFAFWANLFSEYKVKGCKIEYTPDMLFGGTEQYKDLHVGSQPEGTVAVADLSPAVMKQYPDYKYAQIGKKFSKYISVSKFEKKRFGGLGLRPVSSEYSQGNTFFTGRVANLGTGANDKIGTFSVTYYCYFRGPKVAY